MNRHVDLHTRPARQQNYQFAYHLVPGLLYRTDFASTIPMAHPMGFDYWISNWSKMSIVFPSEHVVQDDGITSEAYFIGEGAYALLVKLPSPDFSLEASHLIVVFRPAVEYFVLGNGVDGAGTSTLRKVDTRSNSRCGQIRDVTDQSVLEGVCAALGIVPEIRRADDDEFREIAESIPRFPTPADPLPFNDVWQIGVMYRVLSLVIGDTSNLSPAETGELLSRLPPQAHTLGTAYLELIASKPDLTRADMDSLVEANSEEPQSFGLWIVLGVSMFVLCLVGEIGRRMVPGPNPNPNAVTGITLVFASLGMASCVYAFFMFRRTRTD